MKTILVTYTNVKISSKKELRKYKFYAFNTEADLKVGDMLKSQSYSTKMQVVKVLKESFLFYNASTGDLADTFTSTAQREIATLELRTNDSDVIYASKVEEEDF